MAQTAILQAALHRLGGSVQSSSYKEVRSLYWVSPIQGTSTSASLPLCLVLEQTGKYEEVIVDSTEARYGVTASCTATCS